MSVPTSADEPVGETKETVGFRLAFRKWLAGMTGPVDRADRTDMAELMAPRERHVVMSPLDSREPIAEITRTKLGHKATVTDGRKLAAWLADEARYPALVETYWEVTGKPDEVVDALLLHAPDLLAERQRVRPWAEKELLAICENAGTAIGPSGEADMPGVRVGETGGVPQVRLTDRAGELIGELWRAGRIELDGTVRGEIAA